MSWFYVTFKYKTIVNKSVSRSNVVLFNPESLHCFLKFLKKHAVEQQTSASRQKKIDLFYSEFSLQSNELSLTI